MIFTAPPAGEGETHGLSFFFLPIITHNYLVRPSEPSSWFLILSSVSVTGRTLKFISLKRSRCCRGVLDPSSLIWYRKHHKEGTTVIICHVGCSLISIYLFFIISIQEKFSFNLWMSPLVVRCNPCSTSWTSPLEADAGVHDLWEKPV